MALLIGMDEAGYGPNYGPLIVGATVWEVPGDPRKTDLWSAFAGIVEQTAPVDDSHIQIADSKQVYNPAKGLINLERGVLRALAVHRRCAGSASTFINASQDISRNVRTSSNIFCRTARQ